MDYRVTTLERAFEMARSGHFSSVAEIKKQLKVEGFSVAQVTGRALTKQLKDLIRAAQEQNTPEQPASSIPTASKAAIA
jgi:hypothetical protein